MASLCSLVRVGCVGNPLSGSIQCQVDLDPNKEVQCSRKMAGFRATSAVSQRKEQRSFLTGSGSFQGRLHGGQRSVRGRAGDRGDDTWTSRTKNVIFSMLPDDLDENVGPRPPRAETYPRSTLSGGNLEESPGGNSSGSSADTSANHVGTVFRPFARRALIGSLPLALALVAPGPKTSISRVQRSDQNLKTLPLFFEEACSALTAEAATVREPKIREAYDENKLLEQNRRIQKLNNAPENFPGFVREGFEVKVVAGPEWQTSPSGLIYYDLEEGSGENPQDGQQVIFHYIGYNEQARRVDSTYLKGTPARTRVGIGGLIPGFEEGIKNMKVGGKRRIVVPPELGPPTGPSTFFSAKQYEVFDIELLSASNCVRRQVVFYSDVVCE